MKFGSALIGCALAFVLALPAAAHEQQYAGTFLGTSESPSNASPGTGSALVTVDFDLVTMRVQASFSGLVTAPAGGVTASHIHCCLPGSPNPLNAGVATQVPSFTGFPLGVTAGSYDHLFDMSLADSYNPAFVTANASVSGAFNALVNGLNAGNAYFNIHTSAFPAGEIRALLAPVPEPETWALLGAGLGLLSFVARRRAKA
ncbi:MAG: CHRD domain-containing protein [Burkholderiaceae bacterium]